MKQQRLEEAHRLIRNECKEVLEEGKNGHIAASVGLARKILIILDRVNDTK